MTASHTHGIVSQHYTAYCNIDYAGMVKRAANREGVQTMPEDYTVRVISVKEVPAVGADLQFHTVTRVVIMVGSHGTFTKDFPAPGNTPEIINAWKAQKQHEVQAIVGS